MPQKYGKIYLVHGLKNLTLLKMTILQGDLQIKCNIYQNTSGIFHKTRTNYSKICMETKRPSIVKENFEKEKRSWK